MNQLAGQHEVLKFIQGIFDAFKRRDAQRMED